jgi:iron complex outermembrane recepter protein
MSKRCNRLSTNHSIPHSPSRLTRQMRWALLCMSATMAGPTLAQQQQGPDTQLDRVVVTGSLIPRTLSETTEAVTVIKAEALKNMGITTVEQALGMIASNQSGVITASAVSSWGTGGGSFASLRGLGASKTLVLLDGQRLANNVVLGSAVDLNGIPFAAIERIEVLREGASSVYGTDAIAGVINFITKQDLQGGQANLNTSASQGGGGNTSNADIAWGTGNLAKDGYNLLVTANYSKVTEMTASQRKFAATGWNPKLGLANQNGPMGTFPGSYTDNNTNVYQVGFPTCAGNPYLNKDGGNCAYLFSAAVDLIPPQTMASGMVSFTKSLGSDHTLNLQYFYAQSKVSNWGGPQTYSFTMTPSSNPTYFPTAANSTYVTGVGQAAPDLVDPITVGWTDPGNNRYQGDKNTEQRLLGSLKGTLSGWDYSANVNYSVNKNALLVVGGYADYDKIAPNGVLSDLINPFGALSPQGQALINSAYLNGKLASGKLSLWDVNVQASRDVGDFFGAGKPATLAVGVDARQEKIGFYPTPLATTLYLATFYPPAAITGSRNSQALYTEFNLPLHKDFTLVVSDRQDRYNDFGSTNNAKVSALYQPSKLVSFRAAASTGFRAPSLVDLYQPQVLGAAAGSMTGPGCATGNYDAIFTQANCLAQGISLSGGNPKLKPEKSKNFDFGIILAPMADLGVTLDFFHVKITDEIQSIPDTAIYADPKQFAGLYKLNSSGSLTQAPLLNTACPNGPSSPTCGYVIQTVQNTGGITTNGVDLSSNYQLKTAMGKFRFGMEGTWIHSFRLQEYAGAPWLSLRGRFNSGNQPAITWQHQLTVDWTNEEWGAGLSNHYTSSYLDQFPDGSGAPRSVGSYSVWNAYASWKPMPSLKLLVGVHNLLNTDPPFSNQTQNWQAGYNPLFSDPTGRAWYVRASYDF